MPDSLDSAGKIGGTCTEHLSLFHEGVEVFSVWYPSETFSRDAEPYKLLSIWGSGVSEGYQTEKTVSGKNPERRTKAVNPRSTSPGNA